MCELTAATMFAISAGLSAAQGVASVVGQRQQYKYQAHLAQTQAQQQNEYTRKQQDAIQRAYVANLDTLGLRQIQEQQNAKQSIQEASRDALRARSTARVASGEGGVAGLSVEALVREVEARSLAFADSVNQNLERSTDQIQREKEGARAGAQSQINAAYLPLPSMPKRPDFTDALFQTAGGVFNAYGDYRNRLKIERAPKGGG